MNTKYANILFLMVAIIMIGFSEVSAQPVTLSTPIEMDERRNTIIQGERISSPGSVNASNGDYTDRIYISWESVVEAEYYELYVSTDDDSTYAYLLDTVNTTSYDDNSEDPGTYYYYWVKACDTSECSDYSNSDSGWLDLDPPTSVSASDGDYTDKVEVTWNLFSRATFISSEVWRNTGDNLIGAELVASFTDSPFSDSNASPGTYYYYWVKACGDDFCSDFSTSDQGYMAVEAPTGVTATDGTYTDRVDVEWNYDLVSLHEVFRNTSDDSSGAISLGTEYGSSFWDTTAEPGTVYYYWVKACGPDVSSAYSTSDSGYRLALSYHLFLPLILK